MKKNLCVVLIILLLLPFAGQSQAGTWTWVQGSNTTNSVGNYGLVGIPSATNEPPAKYAAAFWTDTAGNFWLYGGVSAGATVFMDDLWEFDPLTQIWTWMNGSQTTNLAAVVTGAQGAFDIGNQPSSLGWGVFTWTTPDNHLWMFGGAKDNGPTASGDMWQYDPSINQWAWMGIYNSASYGSMGVQNPTNSPGPRYENNTAWQDNAGNLWLWGGLYPGPKNNNDLWRYNILAAQWTWMGGTIAGNDTIGAYGTLGVSSVNNYPPSRLNNFFWTDDSANFWMIGGELQTHGEDLQDVWKYNPQTSEWTWMSGQAHRDEEGPHGTNCLLSDTNNEGWRYENRGVWKVNNNLILNYSGVWLGASSFQLDRQELNQLWGYIPTLGEWLLLNGSTEAGSYGTQDVSNFANYPPWRSGSAASIDKNKNIWLFGGVNFLTNGYYNDLWEFVIDTACIPQQSVQPLQITTSINGAGCTGNCTGSAAVNINQGTPPYAFLWSPGNYTSETVNGLCPGSYTVTVSGAGGTSATDVVTIAAGTPPQISLTTATIACNGDSALVVVSASGGTPPYTGTGSFLEPAGTYYYTVTDSSGCSVNDTATLTQPAPLQVQASSDTNNICSSDSALVCATSGFVSYFWNTGQTSSCIYVHASGQLLCYGNRCQSVFGNEQPGAA